jgi:hypothetical protein
VPAVDESLKKRSEGCKYRNDLERLRVSAYHAKYNEPPYITAQELASHLDVFYVLLDLGYPHIVHRFSNDVDQLPLDLDTLMKRIPKTDIENAATFYTQFLERQYEWCPVMFELEMSRNIYDRVIPLYRREEIRPHQDTHRTLGSGTVLWKVEVPEELVGPRLREKFATEEMGFERNTDKDIDKENDQPDRNPGKVCAIRPVSVSSTGLPDGNNSDGRSP